MSHLDVELVRLYDTVFDRAPDPEGRAFWNNSLDNGYSFVVLAEHFMRAPEFAATYGAPTTRQFVESLYENILDRPGEEAGIAFWTAALDEGRAQRAETVIGFSESPEHVQQMERPSKPPPAPDVVVAEPAPDPAPAPRGSPIIAPDNGPHTLIGGAGNDTILGGPGNDILSGLDGGDILEGASGNDLLIGGAGNDAFIFRKGDGFDRIADFERGDRVLFLNIEPSEVQSSFTGTEPTSVAALRYSPTDRGGSIIFEGLTYADLPWVFDSFAYGFSG